MANMLYNGVELPALPEWDKTAYPYAAIEYINDQGLSGAYLYCTNIPLYYDPTHINSDTAKYHFGDKLASYSQWGFISNEETLSAFAAMMGVSADTLLAMGYGVGFWFHMYDANELGNLGDSNIIWSSYNIVDFVDNTVYLAASDPVDPNAGSHVTESSGDGFALYNGVKLPNIDTVWTDKVTYPYAAIALIQGQSRVLALWSMQASVTDTNLVYPVGMQTALYANTGSSWILSETESFPDGSSSATLDIFSAEWCSYDLINTSTNTVYLAASDPIPLDGMNVIEWNGKTGGLTSPATNFYVVSQYVYPTNALAVVNNAGTLYVGTTFAADSSLGMWVVTDGEGGFSSNQVVADSDYGICGYSNDGAYTALIAYKIDGDLKPVYLRVNGAWVKQTAYERQNGEWVLISTAEKTEETATMLYNGVELPNINAVWDKETYPYAGIIAVEDGVVYNLYLIDSESYIGADGYIGLGAGKFAFYGCITDEELAESEGLNAGEWVYSTDGSSDSEWSIDPSVPFWSNHNILNTDGSIYLLATDPVPVT